MPFEEKSLRRFEHTGSPDQSSGSNRAMWSYITNEDAAAVQTTGFFNDMAADMKVGDMIFAALDLDGTPAGRIYLVTANTGTVVTIAPFQATAIV